MPAIAATLCLLLGLLMTQPADADPLAAHRWRSRLLVVVAPSPDDARLDRQRRMFEESRGGNRERDLVLIEAIGSDGEAGAIRRRFEVKPEAFRAILVGKDGGAKLASPAPLPAERLFREIDAMPMRRSETGRNAQR